MKPTAEEIDAGGDKTPDPATPPSVPPPHPNPPQPAAGEGVGGEGVGLESEEKSVVKAYFKPNRHDRRKAAAQARRLRRKK